MNGCQDNTTCNISQSSSSVNASPETGCPDVQANFQFVLFPVVYSIVFVLGLAGNLTALWHFIKTRSATQPSNVFLVNLCSIDLLLALTLPLKIVYHALGNNWIFGEALCKVDGSLFFGNVYGSSLFLMLISLDRYVAVVHPLFSLRIRKPKYRIILSCGVWIILICAILFLTMKGPLTSTFPGTNNTACMENFSSKSWKSRISEVSILSAVIGFFIPCTVIVTTYPLIAYKLLHSSPYTEGTRVSSFRIRISRVKQKALRTILVVLTVFLVCFAPYHITQLIHTLRRIGVLSGCPLLQFTYQARRVTMALTSLNSCLDPLIYYFASENFKLKINCL
ncbi:GPR17 protein, partial [Polypterus senegalus]|nr:GPR17 protein [Polypterus senegalus]